MAALCFDCGRRELLQTARAILALYRVTICVPMRESMPSGYRGVAIAINLESEEDADGAVVTAAAAGATVPKDPQPMESGGYSGYFAYPGGHAGEVAHNPSCPIGEDGRPQFR
ncbi:putative glyoxalase superfamily protein PhnB [Allocatelliglobosispora scoriae]|uniref:Putative glyoxalase superfamily protein PhnB n=1 Tax=Allocatelliglobosispora scoriae TaxID=643052 RepID=A0A841BW69_9ACTN|nr:hypothetical protein [Allocatelliglobosispora scoriae]MBB5871012.1 putative glyoxalase superfamily protein PhnB [Allocatelliglobosispora scoriae]